ncbi:hypothetical protein MAR_029667 [Mya arenaria]|uniref:Uncharacterized protein n=1 Tax=Mya arenaria TaxID=6604 RepID=A0ABY7DJU8_MYAAR|nr:hypothetical protein MAR_029667 [Mya arenaria]
MTQDEDVDVETNDGKSLNRNPWKVEQTPQLPKVEPPVGQDELDEGVAGVLIVVLGGPEVVTGRLHLRLAPPLIKSTCMRTAHVSKEIYSSQIMHFHPFNKFAYNVHSQF